MRHVTPLAPAFSFVVALSAAMVVGCTHRGPGGARYADVPNRAARSGDGVAATTKRTGATAYRGFCEEHGVLSGPSTDEARVDRVVQMHNALYHGAVGSRIWIGEKIAVADGW
jgi:hypothetical protein